MKMFNNLILPMVKCVALPLALVSMFACSDSGSDSVAGTSEEGNGFIAQVPTSARLYKEAKISVNTTTGTISFDEADSNFASTMEFQFAHDTLLVRENEAKFSKVLVGGKEDYLFGTWFAPGCHYQKGTVDCVDGENPEYWVISDSSLQIYVDEKVTPKAPSSSSGAGYSVTEKSSTTTESSATAESNTTAESSNNAKSSSSEEPSSSESPANSSNAPESSNGGATSSADVAETSSSETPASSVSEPASSNSVPASALICGSADYVVDTTKGEISFQNIKEYESGCFIGNTIAFQFKSDSLLFDVSADESLILTGGKNESLIGTWVYAGNVYKNGTLEILDGSGAKYWVFSESKVRVFYENSSLPPYPNGLNEYVVNFGVNDIRFDQNVYAYSMVLNGYKCGQKDVDGGPCDGMYQSKGLMKVSDIAAVEEFFPWTATILSTAQESEGEQCSYYLYNMQETHFASGHVLTKISADSLVVVDIQNEACAIVGGPLDIVVGFLFRYCGVDNYAKNDVKIIHETRKVTGSCVDSEKAYSEWHKML